MITVNATMSQMIKIGHQGENKAVQVFFDLTPFQAEFQGGYPHLVVRRPGDQSGYPVALIVDGPFQSTLPVRGATRYLTPKKQVMANVSCSGLSEMRWRNLISTTF